jgi:hypothetical protein
VPCRLLLLLSSESTFARASKFDFGARRIFRFDRMVKECDGGRADPACGAILRVGVARLKPCPDTRYAEI